MNNLKLMIINTIDKVFDNKKDKNKCKENHDPNYVGNSLKSFPNKEFVFPQVYYFQCCVCKKPFKFIKVDNKFKKIK